MTRIRVVIDIDYDKATIEKKSLSAELKQNVETAISGGLLNDSWGEAIVDEYRVNIQSF